MNVRFSPSETRVRLDLEELRILVAEGGIHAQFPLPATDCIEWFLELGKEPGFSRAGLVFRLNLPEKILAEFLNAAPAARKKSELQRRFDLGGTIVLLEVDFFDREKWKKEESHG